MFDQCAMPSWHGTALPLSALQLDYKIEWSNGQGTFTREFSYDEQGLLAVLTASAKPQSLPTHCTARASLQATGGPPSCTLY